MRDDLRESGRNERARILRALTMFGLPVEFAMCTHKLLSARSWNHHVASGDILCNILSGDENQRQNLRENPHGGRDSYCVAAMEETSSGALCRGIGGRLLGVHPGEGFERDA